MVEAFTSYNLMTCLLVVAVAFRQPIHMITALSSLHLKMGRCLPTLGRSLCVCLLCAWSPVAARVSSGLARRSRTATTRPPFRNGSPWPSEATRGPNISSARCTTRGVAFPSTRPRRRWFRLAADQHDADAQYALGVMYEHGQGVEQSPAEAIRWYLLAADQGNAAAQNNLGLMYSEASGVPQDYKESAKWLRLAAVQGVPESQFALWQDVRQRSGRDAEFQGSGEVDSHGGRAGPRRRAGRIGFMYLMGQGVSQDDKQAAKWLQLAADQDVPAAQNNLGLMYMRGQGVEQICEQAAKWLQLAAERGLPTAQQRLGTMYEHGRGVPQDEVAAFIWYSLGAGRGNQTAQDNRDSMARRLSPEQRTKAEEMAKSWAEKRGVIPSTARSSG